MLKSNPTTSPQNANIVSLTPSQKEFVKLLLDDRIHESGQNDDLDYYINVQIKGKWTKLIWLICEVQPLVDAGFLYQFPNRWNQEHLVVVINEDCRAELTLAVLL